MKLATALAASTLALTFACQQSGSSRAGIEPDDQSGVLLLEITDAPMDLAMIASVVVSIDQVLIHHEADGESGFVELYSGNPVDYELSNLRNGMTSGLAKTVMEPGTYRQLRVRMAGGTLTLEDGRVFSTEDGTLMFNSQDTSGMKFFMDPPVEIVEGRETKVLLDFLLNHTFHPIPANDIDNARAFKWMPVVRVGLRDAAGDVDGLVVEENDSGEMAPVGGAMLYLVEAGESDMEQAIASTITEADGTAAFLAIDPGTYDLVAVWDDGTSRMDGITVTAGEITAFTFQLD